MQRKLIEFLHASAGRRFVLGQNDCCLLMADWWKAVHGVDPVPEWRGAYRTEADKHALIEREGGLPAFINRLADAVGAKPTDSPAMGDIGIIDHNGVPYGAICTGTAGPAKCWAVRSETGIAFVTAPTVIAAWSIHE
jgi:hypothetical protein